VAAGDVTGTAAVLTVSDGVAHGSRVDESGKRLAEGLEALGFAVVRRGVVPDEPDAVARTLAEWCDAEGAPNLLLTTGGTGLGPRDRTPEATRRILDREAPGIAERVRAEGSRGTPLAALSRGTAGVRGRTLIVNLAGSPRAAREGLDALAPLLSHAVHILGGGGHP
jgi:molybdopterin adenylyltransferase